MTTVEPVPTIPVLTGTMEGSRTMMDYETILAMKALHEQGHSATRIAKLLGCGRNTVLRHMRNDFAQPQREAPPRSLDQHQDFLLERFLRHAGNADVVRQELAAELGIEVSTRTVQRAVKPYRERLRAARLATQRYETKPGKQLQIDFGVKMVMIEGREQEVNAFVATLGYSRRIFVKAYAQETQTEWFDGMEATFAHFGGVPKTILMDNAKALITTPRSDDAPAVFNERLYAFARYWGFTARACWPYRPRTKGKVERSVDYVKDNGLAGRMFASWGALDRHLATWTATVSDHRALELADGATPLDRFDADYEALTPIHGKPPFGAPRKNLRKVNADAAIVVDTNTYSVPWQLIGHTVEVAMTATTVSIYHQAKVVAEHPRCEGRHQRCMDKAHFQLDVTPTTAPSRESSLTRSLQVYEDHATAQMEVGS